MRQSDGKTSIANAIIAIMGSTSRNVLSDFDKVVIPKPDLRLEAKLSAEENSRMFAGRQVQELSEPGSDVFKDKSGNGSITCGPIHVVENIKDDTSSLDWRNWLFLENSTHVNSGSESSNSSVLRASVECLNFDKLLSTLDPVGTLKEQTISAMMPKDAKVDLEVDESGTSSVEAGYFRKSHTGQPLSRFLQERLSEHTVSSREMTTMLPPSSCFACSPGEISQKLHGKNNVACDKVQTLILVEDVDIFPEDRGCIAAIQQIAETARGPIILTSNNDNPGLPDNFDRLHVSFSLPTPKELLCHLYSVCLREGASIHPLLLEKFIQSCDGDIRKTIMHLQFWLQSKIFKKDLKAHTGVVDEELLHINESQNDLDEQYMETGYIKAKKVEMIQRNGSITDYCELEIQCKAISEFSNSSGSPVASYLQNGQRKLVVMSSDSEEKDSNNGYPQDTDDGANKRHCIKGDYDEHVKYSEAADVTCINDTSQSFDISCVPESTFVPETAIENGTDTMSGAVSSGHCLEVSMNNELKPSTLSVPRRLAKLSENSDILMDTEVPDSSQKDPLQDFPDENMETTIIKVMDECSRVDFKLKSTFVESSPSLETDVWLEQSNFRSGGVSQVVKLDSGLSNLISEAELFYNYQHKHDILESRSFVSNETTTSWYNDETMMSSVAVHGFCFYVKLIADVGSKLDWILPKAVIYTGKELELNNPMESENKASLFEVVQSIVPARISLTLKGDIFNEYLSSLRQISRSEAVRVSQGVEKKRRGRSRGAQHYLSRCTMLSPENITLVSGDLYRKISSQHTTNVESKLL
ncbi:P-loop containing nucleoside triphosphate hydrolase superfamily protein [Trifolium repens]|nr:P-loop containing nucleoside triphosphate hydrolase superfamily protein [Trifolium repens]